MIRYKQLVTLNILDKDTNESIGSVVDVLYSEDYKKVNYLVIKNNNLLKNKIIVDYNNFAFQKNNKILYINNTDDIVNHKMYKYIQNTKKGYTLIDKEIRNQDEECIGFVKDVIIDKDSGKVDGFIITEGFFEDLFKGRNYVPFLDTIEIKDQCIYIPSNIFI